MDTFITKDEDKFSSYYFRHSRGTGKTVLLKLFGKELQKRGFVVFLIDAPFLDDYSADFFKTVVNKFGQVGKDVALLVDEVQNNAKSKHWGFLLKGASTNLLVVGTGINELQVASPPFLIRYPSAFGGRSFITQLTEEDMPEVLDYFIPNGEADTQYDMKKNGLNELLVTTGGQLYPFVRIFRHLLEPENVTKLDNLSAYLSSENFFLSKVYASVCNRCFDCPQNMQGMMERFLLGRQLEPNDIDNAEKSGLWMVNDFVSPLLKQAIFRQVVSVRPSSLQNSVKLDLTSETIPVVQQIITAGLVEMEPEDFLESNFSTMDNNERSLAFRWGVCCGAALKHQVWLSNEVITKEKEGQGGAKPTIDFLVNGKLNLGLELAKNRNPSDMLNKLKKSGEGGVYSRHNSYIFHFVFNNTLENTVKQIRTLPSDMQTRVYTFMKNNNALLCGTNIVQRGVVRKLPSHPLTPSNGSKQFSTMTLTRTLGVLTRLRLGRFI